MTVKLRDEQIASPGYQGIGGSQVSSNTVGPEASAAIATVGTQASIPATILFVFYGTFEVSTAAGAASFQIELLVDDVPAPDPVIVKSGFTPPSLLDPVVYTTGLSFQSILEADTAAHTYKVLLTTGPGTTVTTTIGDPGGALTMLSTLGSFS